MVLPPLRRPAAHVQALATSLFASERLLHFDMSECADRTAVSRLVGAAPGYVGYGEGGVLTEAVRWAGRWLVGGCRAGGGGLKVTAGRIVVSRD